MLLNSGFSLFSAFRTSSSTVGLAGDDSNDSAIPQILLIPHKTIRLTYSSIFAGKMQPKSKDGYLLWVIRGSSGLIIVKLRYISGDRNLNYWGHLDDL